MYHAGKTASRFCAFRRCEPVHPARTCDHAGPGPDAPRRDGEPVPTIEKTYESFYVDARSAGLGPGSAPPASRRPKRRERPLPRILCALVRVCRLLLRQRADDFRHPHSIQAAIILLFRQVEVFPFVARSVFQHACSPLRRCAVAWSASVPRNRSPPVCC